MTTQRDERVDDLPEQFSEDVLRAVATFEWLDSVVTNDAAHIVRDTCAEIMPSREHLGHPAMSVVNQLWRLGRKFEAALVVARIWAEVTDRQRALGMPSGRRTSSSGSCRSTCVPMTGPLAMWPSSPS